MPKQNKTEHVFLGDLMNRCGTGFVCLRPRTVVFIRNGCRGDQKPPILPNVARKIQNLGFEPLSRVSGYLFQVLLTVFYWNRLCLLRVCEFHLSVLSDWFNTPVKAAEDIRWCNKDKMEHSNIFIGCL